MKASEARKVELDVRPHLKNKLEPFQLIMDTVKTLGPDDVFVLHAPFRPTPLLGVMKMKGFAGRAVPVAKDHWIVHFVRKKNRHWLDELALAEAGDGRGDSTEDGDGLGDASAEADLPAGMPLPFRPGAEETRGDADESGPAGREPDADGEPRVITLDNRGLEPPQPMIRTLSALERCRPGDTVRIHNDRVPVFLLEELKNLGCPYEVEEQPDGSAKVTIRKV
ncbi:MAG: universal stress protein [Paenibacillaceae bacterium ZCTH02-B3]|nr:MAG: universal stress protein [Paenibacillaceae bacterium ZCTH02-B3]